MDRKRQKIEKAVAPQWVDLPEDVTANILHRLGVVDILKSAQKVCTTWWRLCQDSAMWRVIKLDCRDDRIPIMWRYAVDRSRGQLLDLTISYFGHDNMLNYIVDRSSYLKRLTLHCCNLISGKGLAEAAKKLPHLEELHLVVTQLDQASDIEIIGIYCPKLKSFTFNQYWEKRLPNGNEYAFAIAKNMPNLRHLRLFSEWITNEALEGILDGCPNLESLDLRRCFDLDLHGILGKRCLENIKNLKCPFDSHKDDEWIQSSIHSVSHSIYRFV